MKRIFVLLTACAFMACNNEKADETNAGASGESRAQVPSNTSGFTPAYSVSFVMDSAKNTETILSLWKAWKDGDLSVGRQHFADSVAMFFPDGSSMAGPADSVMKNTQAYRSSFKSVEVTVDAAFAVKSTDRNESWVAIWGSEIITQMNGTKDTISQQETWRFNKEGKIDFMIQAQRKGMTPPPPGK